MMTNTPRTCDQLGVCQAAEYGACKGECRLCSADALPIQFMDTEPEPPEPMTQFEHFLEMVCHWATKAAIALLCLVLGGITAGATLALILMTGGR